MAKQTAMPIGWWMEKRGIKSQAALSKASGLSPQVVSRVLNGKLPSWPVYREALCKALKVTEKQIEWPNKPQHAITSRVVMDAINKVTELAEWCSGQISAIGDTLTDFDIRLRKLEAANTVLVRDAIGSPSQAEIANEIKNLNTLVGGINETATASGL